MKTVLITGGSSGIGLEMSKRFAQNGYNIFWVSLFEDEVADAKKEMSNEFPKTVIHHLIQDLSKEEGAQNVFNWVHTNNFNIDVLINNAGFATYGMSTRISMEKEVNMIQLNVLSVYKLTRLFLDDMNKKNTGTIINISSSTSFQPVPRMAAYAATKAFVAHYSQGLQEELKEQGSDVKIITVCPAAINDTNFKITAKMEKIKTFEGLSDTTKAEVADDVWKAFNNGVTYLRTGSKLRRTAWLNKVIPKPVFLKLIRDELSEKT